VSIFSEDAGGPAPVVVYQMTERQMAELVERIVAGVAKGPRADAVKLPEAAQLLGISYKTLRRRVEAKVVQKLPDMGPVRISMDEIDRLKVALKQSTDH